MKKNYYLLLIIVSLFSSEIISQNIWEQTNGPTGGVLVRCIINHPNGSIFAGTSLGTIYRSTNKGESWERVYNNEDSVYSIYNFTIDSAGNIYAGTHFGILKSTNEGDSWYRVDNELQYIWLLLSSPEGYLYAIVSGGFGHIYRSTDSGKNWIKVFHGDNFTGSNFTSLGITSNGNLIAGSHQGRVFISTDKGNNWSNIYNFTSKSISRICINSKDDIFLVDQNGVYYSTNSGYNWNSVPVVLSSFIIPFLIDKNDNIYYGQNGDVFKSSDNGNSWNKVGSNIQGQDIISLGVDSDKIFAGTWDGIYLKSVDEDWLKSNKGIVTNSVKSIIIGKNNKIFAQTSRGQIFSSTDNGETWIEDLTLNKPMSLIVDKVGNLYGLAANKIFRSNDNGESWDEINTEINAYNVFGIDDNGTLFIVGRYTYISTNQGVTWNKISEDIASITEDFTTVILFNNNEVYVGTYGSGILKSIDGGYNWTALNNSPHYITSLIISNKEIFTGTRYNNFGDAGVYKSTDYGETWIKLNNGLPEVEVLSLLINNGEILAGTRDYGIYRSTNRGESWEEYNDGLGKKTINSLAINSQGIFYAGTWNFGVYRASNLIVPVELTSFTYEVSNNNVHLNWSTATETNNKGFEIYRRNKYQRNQNSDWGLIGFVEGKGTTSENQNYTFVDKGILSGKYSYKLKQIDFNGSFKYSDEVEVKIIPTEYSLSQNYPNPFNPSTTISYSLPYQSSVKLIIYDIMGREVKSFIINSQTAGTQNITWDGNNENGNKISSGVYIYRITLKSLETNEIFSKTTKMIMLK